MAGFDPNNAEAYYSDPSQFEPQYTADPAQAQAQLANLQAAQTYAQAHPELPDSQYVLQELQRYVPAQQSLVQYLGLPTADAINQQITTQQGTLNSLKSSQLQNSAQMGGGNINQQIAWVKQNLPGVQLPAGFEQNPGNFSSSPSAYLLNLANQAWTSQYNAIPTTIQNQANTTRDTSSADMLSKFALGQPNYSAAEKKLNDYYYDPNQGQIALATKPAVENVYQQAYNLRNTANQQAAALGASSSGSRQKALDNIRGRATGAATNIMGQAQNQAAQAVTDFSNNISADETARQQKENAYKSGTAQDLLSSANQDYFKNYGANTQSNIDTQMRQAQEKLMAQQSNDQLWQNIYGNVGQAAGNMGGYAAYGGMFV